MSTISVTLPNDGETIDAADVNTPINTIVTAINGNLDNANISASAAITGSKLATASLDLGSLASVWDGWIAVSDSWSYASATTITVPTDATTKYSVGDKIKLVQSSTTKYFYITAVAATTLTVTGGTDYTVANSAISGIYYSKVTSPLNFPGWFNYNANWVSSGSAPAIGNGTFTARFLLNGRTCNLRYKFVGGSTTTWGTGFYYLDLPITGYSGIAANDGFTLQGYGEDNGVASIAVLGTRMNTTARFGITMAMNGASTLNNMTSWAATGPFTWSTGDYWSATGFYEI